MRQVVIKIGDQIVLNHQNGDLAYFNLDHDADMLIGLTLLKLGLASSLDDMAEMQKNFTLIVQKHDIRVLYADMHREGFQASRQETRLYRKLVSENAVFNLVQYE